MLLFGTPLRSLSTARVQQQQLAQEVIHHLPDCLATPCIAVQLAACQVMKMYEANPHTRHALHGGEIVKRLVELNAMRHALTAAPAVHCLGIMCDLSSDNADAVIRAGGVSTMLCTLEEDCPAQVWLPTILPHVDCRVLEACIIAAPTSCTLTWLP
jgi:hypothetical protein